MSRKQSDIRLPEGLRFMRELGRGGMGVVLLVEDIQSQSLRILKSLKTSDLSSGHFEQLQHEFMMLSQLNHPNIGKVYDFYRLDDSPSDHCIFFTGEYVDGSPLHKLPHPEEMDARAWIDIIVQIARALQYIHNSGMIHFDVKPSNIIVNQQPDGSRQVKLIDFGLSQKWNQSNTPSIRGSALYVAPEIIRGVQPDYRVDLYSLGVTLYEIFSGSNPFEATNVLDILRNQLQIIPRPLKEIRPGLPNLLLSIVNKLTRKERERRFNSANEIVRTLKNESDTAFDCHPLDVSLNSRQSARFIGRLKEVSRFKEVINNKTSGVCFISGTRGSGKTRFITEMKILAQIQGYRFISFDCQSSNGDVFLNLRTALSHLKTSKASNERTLSSLSEMGLTYSSSQKIITTELCRKVVSASENYPLMLCFEELNVAAVTHHTFIAQLIRSLQVQLRSAKRVVSNNPPVLTIVVSSEETEPEWLKHTLFKADDMIWVPLVNLEMQPLNRHETGQMVDSILGEIHSRESFVNTVFQYSGGIPLLVEETIAQWIRGNALKMRNYVWMFNPQQLDQGYLPGDIGGMMRKKIDSLGPESKELLSHLSAIFKTARLGELMHISGLGSARAIELLNDLAGDQLVIVENRKSDLVYRIANPFLKSLVYESIPKDKRIQLHQKIIEFGMSRDQELGPGEIAWHYLKMERFDDAFHCYHKEGLQRFENSEMDESIRALNLALDSSCGQTQTTIASIELTLAEAYHSSGRTIEAGKLWARLYTNRNELKELQLDQIFHQYAMFKLDNGQFDEAEEILNEAENWFANSEDYRSRQIEIETVRLNLMRKKGDLNKAQEYMNSKLKEYGRIHVTGLALAGFYNAAAELILTELLIQGPEILLRAEDLICQALKIYQDHGKKTGEIRCHNKLGMVAQNKGDTEDARHRYKQGAAISRQIGDRLSEAICLSNIPPDFNNSSWESEIEKHIRLLDVSEEAGAYPVIAGAYNNIGANNSDRSNIEIAVKCFERAIKIYNQIGHKGRTARTYYSMALAYGNVCDYDNALINYRKCVDGYRSLGILPHELYASVSVADTLRRLYRNQESEELCDEIVNKAESIKLTAIIPHCLELKMLLQTLKGDEQGRRKTFERIRSIEDTQPESSTKSWLSHLRDADLCLQENRLAKCLKHLDFLKKNPFNYEIRNRNIKYAILIPIYASLGNQMEVQNLLSEEYEYINNVHPNRREFYGYHLYYLSLEQRLLGNLEKNSEYVFQCLEIGESIGNYQFVARCNLELIENSILMSGKVQKKDLDDLENVHGLITKFGMSSELGRWNVMKGLTEVAASNFDHTVIENCIAEAENCFKGQVIWSMQFKILILKIACASSVQSQARIRTHLEELNEILTQVSDVLPNTHWLRSIGYWKLDYYFGLLPDVLGNFSEFLSKINCESADSNSPPHLLPGNRLRFANKHQKAIDQPLSELTEFMRGCGTEKANLKESIFNRLKRITNADRVLLMKKNDLKQLVPLDRGFVADDPGLSGFCHSVAWTALQTGQIVKKSWMFGQESQEGLSDSMNALGLLSVMAIPVKKQKEILGVVYLDSQSVMTVFSENELTSLKTVGNLAASLFY